MNKMINNYKEKPVEIQMRDLIPYLREALGKNTELYVKLPEAQYVNLASSDDGEVKGAKAWSKDVRVKLWPACSSSQEIGVWHMNANGETTSEFSGSINLEKLAMATEGHSANGSCREVTLHTLEGMEFFIHQA